MDGVDFGVFEPVLILLDSGESELTKAQKVNKFVLFLIMVKNVKNPDLWQRFVPLFRKHKVQFHWIKGHAGHPENEICDQLAVKASQSENLKTDAFFENQKEGGLF